MGEVSGGDSQYHSQQQHGQSGGEQHSQVTSSSNFNHDHARRSDNDGSAFDHSREDHRLYFDNGQQIYPLQDQTNVTLNPVVDDFPEPPQPRGGLVSTADSAPSSYPQQQAHLHHGQAVTSTPANTSPSLSLVHSQSGGSSLNAAQTGADPSDSHSSTQTAEIGMPGFALPQHQVLGIASSLGPDNNYDFTAHSLADLPTIFQQPQSQWPMPSSSFPSAHLDQQATVDAASSSVQSLPVTQGSFVVPTPLHRASSANTVAHLQDQTNTSQTYNNDRSGTHFSHSSRTHTQSQSSASDNSPMHSPFAGHFPQGVQTTSYFPYTAAPSHTSQFGDHAHQHQQQPGTHPVYSGVQSSGAVAAYGPPSIGNPEQLQASHGNTLAASSSVPRYQGYNPPPIEASTSYYRPNLAYHQEASQGSTGNPYNITDAGSSSTKPSSNTSLSYPAGLYQPRNEVFQAPIGPDPTAAGMNTQSVYPARHFYGNQAPQYTLQQYRERPPPLSNLSSFSQYTQPSPSWTGSPLPSPSMTYYPPGMRNQITAPTDYFQITPSQPSSGEYFKDQQMRLDQLHMPSNPSSPPTSHSPSSLRSEPLYDSSGRIISPREAGHLALVEGDLHAKSNRAGAGGSVSTKGKGTARAGKATGTAPAYVKKETRVEQGICDNCSKVFATINLRGHQQDFGNEFDLVYYCLDCAPESLGISREALEASIGLPTVHVAEAPRDGMSGTSVSKNIFIEGTTGPPNMVKLVPRGPKKRIRATDVSSPTVCDVCSRWIANGAPVPRDQGAELAFNVEIVCTLCTEKYRRCSDCGGGGGARLGVGKWRCKELFSPGRKTCDLSHARQSNVASMEYFTTQVRQIPKEELPELVTKCKAVFESALYSSLAVPEVLERGTAMASTYEDVVSKVIDGWQHAKHVIEEDVEDALGFRRYVGLRWSAPRPRKVATRKAAKEGTGPTADVPEEESPKQDLQHVLRPSMNLSGYVSGEWDIRGGTFYITVSVPYSTGEQYEGSAHLIGLLQKRALEERQEMVNELMKQGKQAEAMNIPPLLHSFTMLFFSPDSKLMAYMESKRQLIPLHRYLERYPDANPRVFPPHRKAYVSANQRPGDWTVLVRRIMPPLHSPSPAVAHLPQARPSLNAQPRHYSDPSLMHLGYQERSKP